MESTAVGCLERGWWSACMRSSGVRGLQIRLLRRGLGSRRCPDILCGAATAGVMAVWYQNIYVLPKVEYNAWHPFTSWIPISCWIVFRNLTPGLRTWSLGAGRMSGMPAHELELLPS